MENKPANNTSKRVPSMAGKTPPPATPNGLGIWVKKPRLMACPPRRMT
jgi:hypothetical protein